MGTDLNLVVECSRKPLRGRKRCWDELLHTRHIHHIDLMRVLQECHSTQTPADEVLLPPDTSSGVERRISRGVTSAPTNEYLINQKEAQYLVGCFQGRFWGKHRFIPAGIFGEGWMYPNEFRQVLAKIYTNDLEFKQLDGLSQLMTRIHTNGDEARLVWWFDN